MTESEIKSLHGRYFSATIAFRDVIGRISISDSGGIYLCQDSLEGAGFYCRDFFGYKYSFYLPDLECISSAVQNFILLPPIDKYHTLFTEAVASVKKTWDVDGGYYVIPVEMMTKITEFMTEITELEPKKSEK
jgi:hypothetical protein